MTVVSLCLYPIINKLAPKFGKKKLIVGGFFAYSLVFLLASVCGEGIAWGIAIAVCAGIPMAILGILPQAVVADIAEVDAFETGEERSGMFFAARTFAMKMGQAISMLIFTSVVASFKTETGTNPMGYRMTAIIATVCCLLGAALFLFYNEKMIMGKLARKNEKN
jgi:GPH family glycoside/pentoside/hexuronide:cation symporter